VTQSGDSLIAFPKKTAILMIQDIVRGDGYKAEVNSLNSKIDKLNTQIQVQDSITTTLKNKCENYEFTIDKYFIINETNKGTIKDLNKTNIRLRKQRNVLGYIAAALLVGLIAR
jgi:hypothetical protein